MPAFSLPTRPRLGFPAASLASERSPTDPSAWTYTVARVRRAIWGIPQLRCCAWAPLHCRRGITWPV